MNVATWLEAFGTVAGVLGAAYVGSRLQSGRRLGFGIWIVSNPVLLVAAVLREAWPLTLLWFVYLALACKGYWANRPSNLLAQGAPEVQSINKDKT